MQYNAAIVLAHLMDSQGHLNYESTARMDKGIEAYRHKEAPLLVTCGWAYRKDSGLPIANAMRLYAVNTHNIPPMDIIAETISRDTVGDAVLTKRTLAVPKAWTHLLVVTSNYHVMRTREIFAFIYGPRYVIDVRGAPTSDTAQLRNSEQASTDAFRSTFQDVVPGDDEAILNRLRDRHPFYNGMVYPRL